MRTECNFKMKFRVGTHNKGKKTHNGNCSAVTEEKQLVYGDGSRAAFCTEHIIDDKGKNRLHKALSRKTQSSIQDILDTNEILLKRKREMDELISLCRPVQKGWSLTASPNGR